MSQTRRTSSRAWVAVFLGILAAVFVLGAIVGYLDAGGSDVSGDLSRIPSRISPMVWLAIAAIISIGSFAIGTRWMQSIDELAQRAHYEAWYWGGSIALTLMSFFIIGAPALAQIVDIQTVYAPFREVLGDATGFASGVFASMVALGVGYSAWWLVFWLRRR